MKRILIICIATLIGFNANAQFALWHYGIIGGPSSTWLLNSNVSGIGQELNYKTSMGGGFGVTLSHNFIEKIGVKLDIIYSMHNQKYTGTIGDTSNFFGPMTYASETKLTSLDLPLMLHIGKSNGFYFEVGPQFSFLLGAKEDFTATVLGMSTQTESNKDYKADFNSMVISADLGFGYNLSVAGLLSIDLGIRLGYGLTDATKTFPQTDFIPTSGAGVEHSLTSTYAHFNGWNTTPANFSYKPTNRVFGSFLVGAVLQIP